MLRALAWLGGAVFLSSIGYFVYFHLIVLGRPAAGSPESGFTAATFNVALFTVFAFHHSVLARSGMKARLSRVLPAGAERTTYVWLASLPFLAVCLLWRPLPGMVYEVGGVFRWMLFGVQLAGVVLTWRGAAVVDPLELAGVRQTHANPRPSEFRVVGPFRLVRHPIYLGWLFMVCAAPTMTSTRLLFALVSSCYLLIAIPWEEKSLVEAFGDRYRAYQREVRWRILPGLW